jgi:hypothetical protein
MASLAGTSRHEFLSRVREDFDQQRQDLSPTGFLSVACAVEHAISQSSGAKMAVRSLGSRWDRKYSIPFGSET